MPSPAASVATMICACSRKCFSAAMRSRSFNPPWITANSKPSAASFCAEKIEGVPVLGEDQQLDGSISSKTLVVENAEQFIQLDLGAGSLRLLGSGQQRPHHIEFGLQLRDRGRQPLVECPLFKPPLVLLGEIGDRVGVVREDQRGEILPAPQIRLGILERPLESSDPALQGTLDCPHRTMPGGAAWS